MGYITSSIPQQVKLNNLCYLLIVADLAELCLPANDLHFWRSIHQDKALSNQNQGSLGFQVYIHIYYIPDFSNQWKQMPSTNQPTACRLAPIALLTLVTLVPLLSWQEARWTFTIPPIIMEMENGSPIVVSVDLGWFSTCMTIGEMVIPSQTSRRIPIDFPRFTGICGTVQQCKMAGTWTSHNIPNFLLKYHIRNY